MASSILVVDDNPGIRETLVAVCHEAGYEADTACCADDALRLCSLNAYNMVFLDIVLGDTDGKTVASAIRNLPAPNSQPTIVALTGFAKELNADDQVRCGINMQLGKPQMPATLIDIIHRVCGAAQPLLPHPTI